MQESQGLPVGPDLLPPGHRLPAPQPTQAGPGAPGGLQVRDNQGIYETTIFIRGS